MAKVLTSRQSQLRVLGSALLVSSGIFLGSMTLDQGIYNGMLDQLFSEDPNAVEAGMPLAYNARQAGNLNIKAYQPILPEASEAVAEETEIAPDPIQIEQDMLWMARCMLSETRRPEEMELVAWVIRNRVDTSYRGKNTYEDVVLDPFQFSAFNPGWSSRPYFMNLDRQSKTTGWKEALDIAAKVLNAEESERPFSEKTRHFYSEISMTGHNEPMWARGRMPVFLDDHNIDARRFRFYRDIF
ncbi:MAG: cell wall hydrolase [Rhodothermia bacterium]|nr:cell wall hydrolase [Rhodothermia bacterium]